MVWSLVRFHMCLWVSISKTFCNYSIGNILISPLLVIGVFWWARFLYVFVFFHFFSMKVVSIKNK